MGAVIAHGVDTRATCKAVRARTAEEGIVTGITPKQIVTCIAVQRIISAATENRIVAVATVDDIGNGRAVKDVTAMFRGC